MAHDHTMVGRATELRVVRACLERTNGEPRVVLVTGPPGIGKSRLLSHACAQAEQLGFRVVTIRCRAAERHLAWCALTEIVESLGVADDLPTAQRRALDLVRLRWGGGGRRVDARLVAAALAGVLRHQLAAHPLVIALDDLHWIDPESLNALEFARRRIGGELTVMAAVRTSSLDEFRAAMLLEHADCAEVALGPLEPADLADVLASHGVPYPRDWRSIRDLSGGNPLYAITLARHFEFGVEPNVMPADLTQAVGHLVDGLDQATVDILAIMAALGPRPIAVLAAVGRRLGSADSSESVVTALEPAEDRGLVAFHDGIVRFVHPLYPAVVLDRLVPSRRRRLHASCAAELDDPVERVHHRSLAALDVDRDLGVAIDAAVRLLSARGAHRSAAELAARGLVQTDGVDDATRVERILRCAEEWGAAGEHPVAVRALDGLDDVLPEDVAQRAGVLARAELLRGAASTFVDGPAVATGIYELAATHAGEAGRSDLAVTAHLRLAALTAFEPGRNRFHADAAVRLAALGGEGAGARGTLAEAWRRWAELQISGRGGSDGDLSGFESVETDDDPAVQFLPAWWAFAHDQVEIAERRIAHACERAARDGRDESGAVLRAVAAEIAVAVGRWSEAVEHARIAARLAEFAGVRYIGEWATAVGNLARVRIGADRLGEISPGTPAATAFALHARGAWLLTGSQLEQAHGVLVELDEFLTDLGMLEPVRIRYEGDLLDAAMAVQDLDGARRLVERLEARHQGWSRNYTAALAGRGRALVMAAEGDLHGALDTAHRALTDHERLGSPDELARMHVVMGAIHRRLRHWHLAADHLQFAVATFTTLGAQPWLDRAADELARIGERGTSSADVLTSAERRIAELAAEGRTNTEIAAMAFVSVKTVEATLTRVYRKLGIRGRVQLLSRM